MRRTTNEMNSFTVWISGTGHEIEGMRNGQPMEEMIMDLYNNAVGRVAERSGLPIHQRKLYMLSLSIQQHYHYSSISISKCSGAKNEIIGNNYAVSFYFGIM